MPHNVGGPDRAIRIVLGIVLLAIPLFHFVAGVVAIFSYVIGAIALVTGSVSFCPCYGLCGIDTSHARHPATPHTKPR
jgi:Protein of unknown function (DUF2892)